MQILYREYINLGVIACRTKSVNIKKITDWIGHQTVYFIHLRFFYLVLVLSHRSPLWQWIDSAREDAGSAAIELYYEQCGCSWHSRRTFVQEQRRVWWRTFLRSLYYSLRNRLVCRLRGHVIEAIADAENGSEDVYCKRCGWGFHAQF